LRSSRKKRRPRSGRASSSSITTTGRSSFAYSLLRSGTKELAMWQRLRVSGSGLAVVLLALVALQFYACSTEPPKPPEPPPYVPEVTPIPTAPAGFEAIAAPPDNPTTPEKAALGRQLFFDKRLSVDGTKSCYSCHVNEHGLTDGLPVAIGAGG